MMASILWPLQRKTIFLNVCFVYCTALLLSRDCASSSLFILVIKIHFYCRCLSTFPSFVFIIVILGTNSKPLKNAKQPFSA